MNQCVPSWDLDENPVLLPSGFPSQGRSDSTHSVPASDYGLTELAWENGHPAMHGLGTSSRLANKHALPLTWDKGGTLESIVNQATCHNSAKSAAKDNLKDVVPWFNHHQAAVNPTTSTSLPITMDALVPCNNTNSAYINKNQNQSTLHVLDSAQMPGTCVGSCNPTTVDSAVCVPHVETSLQHTTDLASLSVDESATFGGRDRDNSHQVTADTYGAGFTSTSPENTSSDKDYAYNHNSASNRRLQRKTGDHDDGKKKTSGKSSVSTKRSRAADIHNQSERKRRDKINQRMKTLQKMVPNSNKTDKASMLDEVIEYLKQLQAQVHMMSRMSMPMMLPLAMQQQLQMSMMGMQMGMGMGMGMGVMDMNSMGRPATMPPVMPQAAHFMPMTSWDNSADRLTSTSGSVVSDPLSGFLACQSQPMNIEAYSRLAAMYQQYQPNPGSGPKN